MNKTETQKIIRRMTFLRRLLKENGLILLGYDPGVSALMKTGQKDYEGRDILASLSFDRAEWSWLEQILLELRKLRKR